MQSADLMAPVRHAWLLNGLEVGPHDEVDRIAARAWRPCPMGDLLDAWVACSAVQVGARLNRPFSSSDVPEEPTVIYPLTVGTSPLRTSDGREVFLRADRVGDVLAGLNLWAGRDEVIVTPFGWVDTNLADLRPLSELPVRVEGWLLPAVWGHSKRVVVPIVCARAPRPLIEAAQPVEPSFPVSNWMSGRGFGQSRAALPGGLSHPRLHGGGTQQRVGRPASPLAKADR